MLKFALWALGAMLGLSSQSSAGPLLALAQDHRPALEKTADTTPRRLARSSRLAQAQMHTAGAIQARLQELGLSLASLRVFVRALKHERRFEVWLADAHHAQYQLYRAWDICAASGTVGPKRRSGDRQVPEGYYFIDRFNPTSHFHLSLGINYPNLSDRHFADPYQPGGDIFIHGGCASIGCIALTDAVIEEVYVLVAQAHARGQIKVPVLIVPRALDDAGLAKLLATARHEWHLARLWQSLQAIDRCFAATRQIPEVQVDEEGYYTLDSDLPCGNRATLAWR